MIEICGDYRGVFGALILLPQFEVFFCRIHYLSVYIYTYTPRTADAGLLAAQDIIGAQSFRLKVWTSKHEAL